MRVAIIGRSEILFDVINQIQLSDNEVSCIISSKEAPEYSKGINDFIKLSKELKVPIVIGSNINEFEKTIKESNSEIGISFNYTGLIPQKIVDIFPLGILNAHGGDLPRYRGNACQAWAILNNEEKIGLCIHKMIGDDLDSGDIIMREYLNIDVNTKITEVWSWMNKRIPQLFLDAISKLEIDPGYKIESQSKNNYDILRCYPRREEDAGINWNQSADSILRLINASNKPYSGAFCEYRGKKIYIWDAEVVCDNEIFCAVPGQVTKVGDSFIEIACGSGKLRIKMISIDGETIHPSRNEFSMRSRLNNI